MVVLINYANEKYEKVRKINSITGKMIGSFDKVIEYSPSDIDVEFRQKNEFLLNQARGNGLWLWKPYFILKTLNEVDDNDIVFYSDSASFFVRSVQPIVSLAKENGIWISVLPLFEEQFTKNNTFKEIGCTELKYRDSVQFSASFLAFKKCKKTIEFVTSWLEHCCEKEVLMFDPRKDVNESDSFIAHREDQSILSLLAKKNEIVGHQDPTQYSVIPEEYFDKGRKFQSYKKQDYKPMIVHHRLYKVNIIVFLKQTAYAFLPLKIARAWYTRKK